MQVRKALVVARYNEDCNWLLPFKDIVHIQNKGEISDIPGDLHDKVHQLDNIGLDQYCYLDYIVRNYENLEDEIVFVQADITQHKDAIEPNSAILEYKTHTLNVVDPHVEGMTSEEIVDHLFRQVRIHGFTLNAKIYVRKNGNYCVLRNTKVTKEYPDEEDTGMLFGDWFDKNIKRQMPEKERFLWFKNGIFGASKKYILTRPKSYYEDLKAQITTQRGEVLHYLERSWYYIFNLDIPVPHTYAINLHMFLWLFKMLDTIVVNSGQPFVEGSLFFYGNRDMHYNEVFLHKQFNLYSIAKNATNILEIGFNAGHSTALMLIANPTSRILHFDLCEHAYTRQCLEFLKSVFGEHRFIDFVEGDSTKTLPAYVDEHPELHGTFDVIHIDGGHTDEVAMSDILYCERFARAGDHTLIVDDSDMDAIKRVIEYFVNKKLIREFNVLDNDTIVDYLGRLYHFIGLYV